MLRGHEDDPRWASSTRSESSSKASSKASSKGSKGSKASSKASSGVSSRSNSHTSSREVSPVSFEAREALGFLHVWTCLLESAACASLWAIANCGRQLQPSASVLSCLSCCATRSLMSFGTAWPCAPETIPCEHPANTHLSQVFRASCAARKAANRSPAAGGRMETVQTRFVSGPVSPRTWGFVSILTGNPTQQSAAS